MDNFEAMWPSGEDCLCAGSDEMRGRVIELANATGLEIMTTAAEHEICSAMMPHFVGMVVAFALGYHAKSQEKSICDAPLLTLPGIRDGCDKVTSTVGHMVSEAMSSTGRRH